MAKILDIITNPDPRLRKKSKPLEIAGLTKKELKKLGSLCDDMIETMIKKDGIGLAASQVGENVRAITINTKNGPIFMLNPELTGKSLLKEAGEEGCLSVPGIFGQVKRHRKLVCQYCQLDGKKIKMKAEGLMARVIQHEVDHLDGILFIDKATKISKHEDEHK